MPASPETRISHCRSSLQTSIAMRILPAAVVRRLPRIKEMQTTFVLDEIKAFKGFPLDVEQR